ncbi:extracellular solute-binding protein [Aeromicrobium sp. CTD01-1L150]|uniref:extracellular solute-binding protein n=1 Tax=Aeromicrobium sp. CTD01-1L150 TaxID=3341830 RepID=UPI0035C0F6FC
MRRLATILSISCLTLAAACSGGASSSTEDAKSIVFVNYGGEAVQAAEKAWLEPFSEETGVDFRVDSPFEAAKLKAMVESGNTTWDIVTVDPGLSAKECGKLFEKRDPDIDMSGMDPAFVADDCSVPVYPQSVVLVYNKDLFKGDDVPTSVTDFMDTERFPGKRIAYNYHTTLPALLLADGVDKDEVFPFDFDRAEKAIDGLGSDLDLHSDLAQESEKLSTGDFAMCLCFTGRIEQAARQNSDLEIVWNGIFQSWTSVAAVKNSKSPASQQEFLAWLADPVTQAPFSEQMAYRSAAKDSGPEVPEKFRPYVSSTNEDAVGGHEVLNDVEYMRENQDLVVQRWNEMTAG